jgi:hypothetical protein
VSAAPPEAVYGDGDLLRNDSLVGWIADHEHWQSYDFALWRQCRAAFTGTDVLKRLVLVCLILILNEEGTHGIQAYSDTEGLIITQVHDEDATPVLNAIASARAELEKLQQAHARSAAH